LDINDDIFAVEVNASLISQQVKAQLASRRRGTHCTKRVGEVRGGGAKPMKQKGSGRARQGSIRAGNMVGGGTIHGPKPRDYSYRLPRSARRAALKSALSQKVKQNSLIIINEFSLNNPSTKTMAQFCQRVGGRKCLVVDSNNDVLKKSTRNLVDALYLAAEGLNVYDILTHETLVLTEKTLTWLNQSIGCDPVDATNSQITSAA